MRKTTTITRDNAKINCGSNDVGRSRLRSLSFACHRPRFAKGTAHHGPRLLGHHAMGCYSACFGGRVVAAVDPFPDYDVEQVMMYANG